MITLITGMPGSGKTLLLVSEFLQEAHGKGRPIVADGIPDLVVPHDLAPEVAQWTQHVDDESSQDGKKLGFTFPQGSLVVIDECQRVFRPRRAGSAVPQEVAAFETHRHLGLDFILITQHPGLLDSNVRRLVGRHLHIRDLGILGRKIYEWPEATEPEKFRTAPVQRSWRLPKSAFNLYKSSSLHIKPKRGIPKGLGILAVTVPLLIGGGVFAWNAIQKKINPPASSAPATPSPSATAQPQALEPVKASPADMLVEFSPVVPGRPETAPAFDTLRVVKNMPVVAGCIKTTTRCTCQNQQGLDAGLDRLQCENWLQNPPFDAYRDQPSVQTASTPPQQGKQPPENAKPEQPTPAIAAAGSTANPTPL